MFTFFLYGTPTSLHMIDDDCLQSTSTQYFILFSVLVYVCIFIYCTLFKSRSEGRYTLYQTFLQHSSPQVIPILVNKMGQGLFSHTESKQNGITCIQAAKYSPLWDRITLSILSLGNSPLPELSCNHVQPSLSCKHLLGTGDKRSMCLSQKYEKERDNNEMRGLLVC